MSEWEILNEVYSRFRSTPNAKEFRKLVHSMVADGYAVVERVDATPKLRITREGVRLLQRLRHEYRSVVPPVN